MKNFITSDLHLGHTNIIKYCNRPFKTIEEMNDRIVKNWNERVKPDDTIIHIGDFCFKGGIEGGLSKSEYWKRKLNGNIIFIRGNHDKNNSTKTIIESMVIKFAGYDIYCVHRPPEEFIPKVSFVLCGHIHEKWQIKKEKNMIMINVGVDVWNFYPQTLDEIVEFYCRDCKKVKNE
jgi:calcineurin-like phosphoesterase family protein